MTQEKPTIWKNMTDAEKGTLLLAKYRREIIQKWCEINGWWDCANPAFLHDAAYRVAPKKPKVDKTVFFCNCRGGSLTELQYVHHTHKIILTLINGVPITTAEVIKL